jgi:hypothetical protein
MVVDSRQTPDRPDVREAVAALLAGSNPLGYTVDELVDALGLEMEALELQRTLDEMVMDHRLARWGIGRGALYTLIA